MRFQNAQNYSLTPQIEFSRANNVLGERLTCEHTLSAQEREIF